MSERPEINPESTQEEISVPKEVNAVDSSQSGNKDISPKDPHRNIIENSGEVTSFVAEIRRKMNQEEFNYKEALEQANAMINKTENLEADSKGMVSEEDKGNISARLMLLRNLVSELDEFQKQILEKKIQDSGENEVQQEEVKQEEAQQEEMQRKKVVIPSEEPKDVKGTEEEGQKPKMVKYTFEEPKTPQEKEKKEDLEEQKRVDNLLRRASKFLACKDALLTEKEFSDEEKGFLKQEFPNQNISMMDKDTLLKMIETREAKLIEMAEEGARIAGMVNVMETLHLSNKGFIGVAGKIDEQKTLSEGLVDLHENVESTYYAVLALREMHEMREKQTLPEESGNSLNKFKKGVSVELEGDENIKWEKKGEGTDSVKISGRDVDRIQREDNNNWSFLKRLLEMAGKDNYFSAIKEVNSRGNEVSYSRESLGNGSFRFDIEWEDVKGEKNLLIITVDLGVDGRGGFWERHDIRKKRDAKVTVEEYWEEVKKENETKTEEREPEEVDNVEDEDGTGNLEDKRGEGAVGDSSFTLELSGLENGKPIIVKREVKVQEREGGVKTKEGGLEEVGDFEDEGGMKGNESHFSTFILSSIREGKPVIVKKNSGVFLRYFRKGGENYYQTCLPDGNYDEPTKLFGDFKMTIGKNDIKSIYFENNEQPEQQPEVLEEEQMKRSKSEEDASELKQKNIKEETVIEDRETEETEAEEKDERIESLEKLDAERGLEEGCVYKIFADENYEIWKQNGIVYYKTEGSFREHLLDKDFLLEVGKVWMLPLKGTTTLSKSEPKENGAPPAPMRQYLQIGEVKKIEKQFEKNNNRK